VEIELSETPFASLPKQVQIAGSFANQIEEGVWFITIFRVDPKDAPNYYNQDKYKYSKIFISEKIIQGW